MAYLGLNNIDDFLETVHPKYVVDRWQDISMNLQEYYFASRLFSKAAPDSMESDHVEWRVQVANNQTFRFTGLFADDQTVRQDLVTHAKMGWSMSTANYIYDINEDIFRTSAVRIIAYMRMLEHSMYNSYFEGMERAMFSGSLSTGSAWLGTKMVRRSRFRPATMNWQCSAGTTADRRCITSPDQLA